MGTEPSDPLPAEGTCRHCKLPLPAGASICTRCNHYQDWRGSLSVSSTILALLVALVAVLTQAIPVAVDALTPNRSNIALAGPWLDGSTLRIISTNSGKEAGSVESIFMSSKVVDSYLAVRFRDPQAALIRPGSNQIVFDVIPTMSADQAKRRSRIALENAKRGVGGAKLDIWVRESNGTPKEFHFTIPEWSLVFLLRDHAIRCESVETPTMQNGCLATTNLGSREK